MVRTVIGITQGRERALVSRLERGGFVLAVVLAYATPGGLGIVATNKLMVSHIQCCKLVM